MNNSPFQRAAAICGFLAVAFGAFGAHAFKDLLAGLGTTEAWHTAVLYHLIHSLMLWILVARPYMFHRSWYCFGAGVILFSGSLYLYALTKVKFFAWITPLGGLAFLAGWAWLAFRPRRSWG